MCWLYTGTFGSSSAIRRPSRWSRFPPSRRSTPCNTSSWSAGRALARAGTGWVPIAFGRRASHLLVFIGMMIGRWRVLSARQGPAAFYGFFAMFWCSSSWRNRRRQRSTFQMIPAIMRKGDGTGCRRPTSPASARARRDRAAIIGFTRRSRLWRLLHPRAYGSIQMIGTPATRRRWPLGLHRAAHLRLRSRHGLHTGRGGLLFTTPGAAAASKAGALQRRQPDWSAWKPK